MLAACAAAVKYYRGTAFIVFNRRQSLAVAGFYKVSPENIALSVGEFHILGVLCKAIYHIERKGQFVLYARNDYPCAACGFRHCRLDLFVEHIHGKYHFALGKVKVKGYVFLSRKRVYHIRNGADSVQSVKADNALGRVRHTNCDPVALFNSLREKSARGGLNKLNKFCICGKLTLKIIGISVRIRIFCRFDRAEHCCFRVTANFRGCVKCYFIHSLILPFKYSIFCEKSGKLSFLRQMS